jgi:hypothetical protein
MPGTIWRAPMLLPAARFRKWKYQFSDLCSFIVSFVDKSVH